MPGDFHHQAGAVELDVHSETRRGARTEKKSEDINSIDFEKHGL